MKVFLRHVFHSDVRPLCLCECLELPSASYRNASRASSAAIGLPRRRGGTDAAELGRKLSDPVPNLRLSEEKAAVASVIHGANAARVVDPDRIAQLTVRSRHGASGAVPPSVGCNA